MANRFPLIVDTSDGNKIKEIEVGDNLNLQGSGIVNASSITVNGALTAQSITVNGSSLSTVATTGSYSDLSNTPTLFSGDYNDLTNKPTFSTSTRGLTDVQNIEPDNGDTLVYNSITGLYEPKSITAEVDLGNYNLADLNNVITTGDTTNKYLKYYSGAWRAANITYAEIQNTPTVPTLVSQLTNDLGFITSETDSQTLSIEGSTLTISNGNSIVLSVAWDNLIGTPSAIGFSSGVTINEFSSDGTLADASTSAVPTESAVKTYVDNAISSFDTVGNFTFGTGTMTTDDSSSITIVPLVTMNSSLIVDQDLTVNGDIISTATGTPEIFSETSVFLTASDRVEVTQSPFKLSSFTSTERDELTAENGDTIYNTTTNKFQGYANGAWVDLH